MISVAQIKKKALNRYSKYLDWILETEFAGNSSKLSTSGASGPLNPVDSVSAGTPKTAVLSDSIRSGFFPLVIPSDKGKVAGGNEDIKGRAQDFSLLWKASKAEHGTGFTLETARKRSKKWGWQTVITEIRFETENDYLSFTGTEKETKRFRLSCRILLKKLCGSGESGNSDTSELPGTLVKNFDLRPWFSVHKKDLCAVQETGSTSFWGDIAGCVLWLLENPGSGLYIREIPLPVHTKFIEQNENIIRSLCSFFRSNGSSDQTILFEDEFGLKKPQSLIRFRTTTPPFECGLTPEKLALYDTEHIETVFVFENLQVYLTFPPVKNALYIFGHGFASSLIKECTWLNQKKLYYFGDLDEHGFEILSLFRSHFPHTKSFCMDRETLLRFDRFRVAGKTVTTDPEHLTKEEAACFEVLRSDPLRNRLEQERIDNIYIEKKIEAYLS